MGTLRHVGVFVAVGLAAAGLLSAQSPFTPAGEKLANDILDRKITGDKLDCRVFTQKPFFDFSFRFEFGYIVDCPYRQFEGKADHLIAIARVQPEAGSPTILGEVYEVPAAPPEVLKQIDVHKFKGELEFSGAIGIGEGKYHVDLLVADDHKRYFMESWSVHAARNRSEKNAESSLQPNAVAPLMLVDVGRRAAPTDDSLRLTVLLDAAPIFPFSMRLRAWDRAFLLGSLGSLMRQLPDSAMRLVAFNIEQQQRVFTEESMNQDGLIRLSAALHDLQLGAIAYKKLERRSGWAELLGDLMNQELKGNARSDAIVFLGPTIRESGKVPRELLSCSDTEGPPVFYLQYDPFPAEHYPDSIDHLTKLCKGRVLTFHSPGELAAAIGKLRAALIERKKAQFSSVAQ